jgi:hypothetical protein
MKFKPGDKVINTKPKFYKYWQIPQGTVFTVEYQGGGDNGSLHLEDFKSPGWDGDRGPPFTPDHFVLTGKP